MADKAKKFKSGWFRVATEGATTDGRKIERVWIEDMAATYSRGKYGARIWLEHLRGILPDSPFKAYGDVLAAKAEEVDVDGETRLALFVQVEPTTELIAMNKAKQKIYTSIEVDPRFADTGRAYLTGLAVTDSPASLGTDILAFCAQNPTASPFSGRKTNQAVLFSEAVEIEMQFEEVEDKPGLGAALFSRVQDLLKLGQTKVDGDFAQASKAIELVAEQVGAISEQVAGVVELTSQVESLQTELGELKTQLGKTEHHSQTHRPLSTGGEQHKNLAEF